MVLPKKASCCCQTPPASIASRSHEEFKMDSMNNLKAAALLISLLATSGCASSSWKNFNYGPGEWLAENTGLSIDTMHSYVWLENPEIVYHRSEAAIDICGGDAGTLGCAKIGKPCHIYISPRASLSTLVHEERHCRGWTHAEPDETLLVRSMAAKRNSTQITYWTPRRERPQQDTALALNQHKIFGPGR